MTAVFWIGLSRVDSARGAAPQNPASIKLDDPKYAALMKELSGKHSFDPAELKTLFSKVVLHPEIIEKFERPPEILPYYQYRKRFINDDLIAAAKVYLKENLPLLQSVEDEFGVPKEIICSILAIETKFGQKGIEKYREFDILNTAFSLYPKREAFYREELIAFLLLCKEEGIDPFSINSSYAGAFGVPQFMPSSFRKYAIDYDKDGKKDLWHSKGDIFASVAYYLKTFHWRPGGLTRLQARLASDSPKTRELLGGGVRKTFLVATAAKMGVEIPIPEQASIDDEVSFAFYQPEEGSEALLALFGNFRAITRYNYSVNYALTIIDFAEILAKKEAS